MKIAFESANQPEVIALIAALDAYQIPLYPAESHHGLDLAALQGPDILFAVARDSHGEAVACAAIAIKPQLALGELKRMYVKPENRGQGIAQSLLQKLEGAAIEAGCRWLALETGYLQTAAITLYQAAGFRHCGPFADYQPDPNSVFMRKELG